MADQENREPEPARDAFERELTTDLKDTTPDRPRGWPLHTRILLGLALIGKRTPAQLQTLFTTY